MLNDIFKVNHEQSNIQTGLLPYLSSFHTYHPLTQVLTHICTRVCTHTLLQITGPYAYNCTQLYLWVHIFTPMHTPYLRCLYQCISPHLNSNNNNNSNNKNNDDDVKFTGILLGWSLYYPYVQMMDQPQRELVSDLPRSHSSQVAGKRFNHVPPAPESDFAVTALYRFLE